MADPTTDRSPDLDQEILIWTKLQVPKDLELDTEWAGLFQPLIRAPGHEGSGWARLQSPGIQSPDMILLVTGWKRTLEQREFTASPSAQLHQENLKSKGIVHVSSHETFSRRIVYLNALLKSYVQLFWIYFPAPVTEAHKAQISKLKGIREPARGINGQDHCNERRQLHFPTKMWATHTESVHGQEAQLMLWPHFWRNAEAASIGIVGNIAGLVIPLSAAEPYWRGSVSI